MPAKRLAVEPLSIDDPRVREALLRALNYSPAPKARKRRRADRTKHLTVEQLAALMAVIKDPRDRAMFEIAYRRGLRASEIGRLQLADLDMRAGRIQFERLKGSTGGQYHLTAAEIKTLRAWLRIRGHEPGPLFPSRRGKGISQQMLDVLMKRYGAAAGIPAELRHMHTLKHSCATHLLDRGESLEDVQDHLGHRNVQNTLLYAKFTNARRQARDKRLREW